MYNEDDRSKRIREAARKRVKVDKLGKAVNPSDTSGVTDLTGGKDGIGNSAQLQMAQQGASLLGIGSPGDTSTEGGMTSGALSGASMGSALGPKGAIIGGILGGIAGGLGASAARNEANKRNKAKYEAQHEGMLGNIEQEKDRKIQNAIGNMKSAFSKNFQNNKSVRL